MTLLRRLQKPLWDTTLGFLMCLGTFLLLVVLLLPPLVWFITNGFLGIWRLFDMWWRLWNG